MIGLCLILTCPPSRSGPHSSQLAPLVVSLCEEVSRRKYLRDGSVTWNAPTGPLMRADDPVARKLRSLLQDRARDRFVPMGLTGAPHQLLLAEESKSEIDWAVSNPWRSGCKDAGFGEPEFILLPADSLPPRDPGPIPVAWPARVESLNGRRMLPPTARAVLASRHEGRTTCLPILDSREIDVKSAETASRSVSRELRRTARAWANNAASATIAQMMVVDESRMSAGDALPWARMVLDAVEALCASGAVELLPLPTPPVWRTIETPVLPLSVPWATDLVAQSGAAQLRKGRTSRVVRRDTLEIVSTRTGAKTPTARPTGRREFDASMMGDITLAGPSVDAMFSDGRFAGFGPSGSRGLGPTRSFLRNAGAQPRTRDLESVTCFSFESDGCRGVRIVEHLPPYHEDARSGDESVRTRFVSDFSFVSDMPALVCTHALAAGTDLHSGPVELIHLAHRLPAGADVNVQVAAGGEWSPSVRLSEITHDWECFGSMFRVTCADETLAVAFLTATGLPLVSSVGLYHAHRPLLAVGGRLVVPSSIGKDEPMEFALLMASGTDAAENLQRLLSGRLPAAILRELRCGPGFTRREDRTE